MILTVNELREHVTTDLGDDALQRLLDAAEEAIVARAGAPGVRTELAAGGYRFLTLGRPAASITSVVETVGESDTTLATDDYQIGWGEMVLERLRTGTNPRSRWGDQTSVVYTPVDDDATREKVQIDLCKLAIASNPGLAAQAIGDWREDYVNNSAWNVASEREAILAQLDVSVGMVVV